jgi:hypothetical protein
VKHKTNLERDPDHQLLQAKRKSAVIMRARIVKHSVDSAMLRDWVLVYCAEVTEGHFTMRDELVYKERKRLFVEMSDDKAR